MWNIQTGEFPCIIQQGYGKHSIHFSSLDSQHFISVSGGKVWKWNIDGHKIAPEYDASCAASSPDGTKLVLYNGTVVQVQSSDSRAVVAKFQIENTKTSHCCFSPDGRLVAIAADHTAYVWDITNSEPCLINIFICHTNSINCLVFSSPTSLISSSWDQSVKFWQISTSSISPDIADLKLIPSIFPIKSINFQAKDGIAL